MSHPAEDDLVLHFYGDPARDPGVAAPRQPCPAGAAPDSGLVAALSLVPQDEVPDRGERYGLEVWQRIRPAVMASERPFRFGRTLVATAASIALIVAAGLLTVGSFPQPASGPGTTAPAAETVAEAEDSRRVLLMAVADHLERSDRVLTEIMNAAGGDDMAAQKGWAEDLLWAGRLYRQSAIESDEQSVAAVLDDVERTLLDIVHTPAEIDDELDVVRRRVDSAALLFKVRVMRDELHQQQFGDARPSAPRTTLSEAS